MKRRVDVSGSSSLQGPQHKTKSRRHRRNLCLLLLLLTLLIAVVVVNATSFKSRKNATPPSGDRSVLRQQQTTAAITKPSAKTKPPTMPAPHKSVQVQPSQEEHTLQREHPLLESDVKKENHALVHGGLPRKGDLFKNLHVHSNIGIETQQNAAINLRQLAVEEGIDAARKQHIGVDSFSTQPTTPSPTRVPAPPHQQEHTAPQYPPRTGTVSQYWVKRWNRNHLHHMEHEHLRLLRDAREMRDDMEQLAPLERSIAEDAVHNPRHSFRCMCYSLTNSSRKESWCGFTHYKVSNGYICMVKDLCVVNGGEKVAILSHKEYPHNPDDRAVDPLRPPTPVVKGLRICNVAPPTNVVYRRNAQELEATTNITNTSSTPVKRSRQSPEYVDADLLDNATWVPGSTLLLAQTGWTHITHFIEGLGLVNARAIQENGAHYHRNGSVVFKPCSVSDVSCMGHPDQVVSLGIPLSHEKSWHVSVLRVLLRDLDRDVNVMHIDNFKQKEAKKKQPTPHPSSNAKNNIVCFKKAVIPGSHYGVFPTFFEDLSSVSQGSRPLAWDTMRREMWEYLQRQVLADARVKNETSNVHEHAFPLRHKETTKRRILVSRRLVRRRIVDWDVFEHIVRSVAKQVSAEVKVIEFGKHGFTEQATAATEADILVGIHGADLTNMIFQNRGSVLIELNPIFFFENRFFDMATALGLRYLAWTCTSPRCAFAKDMRQDTSELWRQHITKRGIEFNVTSGLFPLNAKQDSNGGQDEASTFMWPWDRYAGTACPECSELAQSHAMRSVYYSVLRDSNIRVEDHALEIEHVLWKAFAMLGWADTERRVVPKPK